MGSHRGGREGECGEPRVSGGAEVGGGTHRPGSGCPCSQGGTDRLRSRARRQRRAHTPGRSPGSRAPSGPRDSLAPVPPPWCVSFPGLSTTPQRAQEGDSRPLPGCRVQTTGCRHPRGAPPRPGQETPGSSSLEGGPQPLGEGWALGPLCWHRRQGSTDPAPGPQGGPVWAPRAAVAGPGSGLPSTAQGWGLRTRPGAAPPPVVQPREARGP